MSNPGTICRCGHAMVNHIYYEGACRPGFICDARCQSFTPAAIEISQKQLEKLKECFIALLNQHCADYQPDPFQNQEFRGYDSGCLSANEHALALAVELGWIKKDEVTR